MNYFYCVLFSCVCVLVGNNVKSVIARVFGIRVPLVKDFMTTEMETEVPAAEVVADGVVSAAVPAVRVKKNRSEAAPKTTLFIRNVPFDCENSEFEAFFSEFGPLKGCFVVKDQSVPEGEPARCRGIGFVHFAVADDAEKTLKALEEGTSKFRGRALKADWAQKKNLELSASGLTATVINKQISVKKPVSIAPVLVEAEKMQECILLVLEMEQDLQEDPKLLKALLQRLRRFAPIKTATCPHEEDAKKVMLEYAMPKANYMVYRKLFSKIGSCLLGNSENNGETEKIAETETIAVKSVAKKENKILNNRKCVLKNVEPILPEPIKSFRLIIRNLPFNITRPTQLADYFTPYGTTLEINIPTVQNESNRHGDNDALRGRGFAFVQYSKRAEAEKAMEALNGSIVKTRAIAVDWALAKNIYDKLEDKTAEDVTETVETENVETENVGATEDMSLEESDVESPVLEDEDIEEQIDIDHMNIENASDSEDSEVESSDSSTIFIRNLSFETEEEDLEEYFSSKLSNCSIEYCKIVRNPDTGASRGTAFIKFKNARSAKEVVEISSKAVSNGGSGNEGQLADLAEKRTKKGFKSIVNDPDALMPDQASGFLLNGRLLNITLAVDRKEAGELGRRRALEKISSLLNEEGRDKILDQIFVVPIGKGSGAVTANQIPRLKRNLALINESVPAEDDSELPTAEIKAREMVIQNRAKSSTKNPNLMLSTTRLAVHHLPPRVNESQLKDVIYAGIKEARAQAVKPGNPLKLSKKMLALLPQFDTISKVHSGMHQIKIILHKSKTKKDKESDAKSAKSRGYGFVEWRHPLMALLCVRWFRRSTAWSESSISQMIKSRARALARDYPSDPEAQISTPVVEFATEKLNVLKKRTGTGGSSKSSGSNDHKQKRQKRGGD